VTMSGALVTAGLVATVALGRAVVRHLGIREAAAFSVHRGRDDRAVRPAVYGRRPTTDARYRVDTTPRRAIAVVDRHEDAQAVVDKLADREFPSSTW